MLYNYFGIFKMVLAIFVIVLVRTLITAIEDSEDNSKEAPVVENSYRYNVQGKSSFSVQLPKNSMFIILM